MRIRAAWLTKKVKEVKNDWSQQDLKRGNANL